MNAAPATWLVLGDKPGDNRQVEIIAERLPWPVERRNVIPKPEWAFAKPRVRPTLEIFDADRSDRLAPPWPDLVLTIGRRPSSAALWIRQQNRGRTRIVLVGKPSGPIGPYDLVITSAEQYLPALPNVMTIGLPLMRVDPERIAREAALWAPRLAALPRPWVAVLLGGPTGPFRFDDRLVARVLDAATDITAGQGGSAFVVTSRRTPAPVVEALRMGLPDGCRLFAWGDAEAGNPYAALLGLADAALVTADSISMQTEVARQGLPLGILPLGTGIWGGLDRQRRIWLRRLSTGRMGFLAAALARLGLPMQIRDFEAFHDLLVGRGIAARDTSRPPKPTGAAGDELAAAVARIEALMAAPGTAAGRPAPASASRTSPSSCGEDAAMACALQPVETQEDWRHLHRIRRTVLFRQGRHPVAYDEDHPDDRAHGNSPFLLVLGGRPIGTVRLDQRGSIAIVRLVAIAEEEQGKGHGRQLNALVEAEARRRGVATLHVNAAPDAVGYYEKLGWRQVTWDAGELTGIAKDCVQMTRQLS